MSAPEAPDPTLLASLRDMRRQWGRDTVVRLAEMFSGQSSRLAELHRAVVDGNAAAAVEAAHYLKGTARSLGAERLAELFLEQEMRGRDGNLAGSEPLLAALTQEWERVAKAFEILLAEDEPAG
jgi:HPt (histidine-containing phosphotransfer) domain-containing protein